MKSISPFPSKDYNAHYNAPQKAKLSPKREPLLHGRDCSQRRLRSSAPTPKASFRCCKNSSPGTTVATAKPPLGPPPTPFSSAHLDACQSGTTQKERK